MSYDIYLMYLLTLMSIGLLFGVFCSFYYYKLKRSKKRSKDLVTRVLNTQNEKDTASRYIPKLIRLTEFIMFMIFSGIYYFVINPDFARTLPNYIYTILIVSFFGFFLVAGFEVGIRIGIWAEKDNLWNIKK